jgi:murein DD-endopeptidase / murein LD-carboxypeptidase
MADKSADEIVARARAVLGTPFRLHGRDQENGLDCVGLVALAYGVRDNIPSGYALRGGSVPGFARMIRALHLIERRGQSRAGDVLLMQAGPAQFHFGLWTGESLIHADAILRRTVEMPGTPPWPIVGAWHKKQRSR